MFDPDTIPLPGMRLIEASAGTGKTYNIGSLVVRAIREDFATIDQILIVTFTNAATAELRNRVRSRLETARRETDDPDARERFEHAVRDFDQSSILTIHSFCQRILRDRAFECSRPFDTELVRDADAFQQQVADDFWWAATERLGVRGIDRLLHLGISPDTLRKFEHWPRNRPDRQLPPRNRAAARDAIARLEKMETNAAATKEAIRQLIKQRPFSNEELRRKMDEWLNSDKVYLRFDLRSKILERSGFAYLHDLCLQLPDKSAPPAADLLHIFRVEFLQAWLVYRDKRSARFKGRANIQFFSDLIFGLDAILHQPAGAGLIRKLRDDFRLVLIDEFQDTDPVQTRIFTRCFGPDSPSQPDAEHPRGLFFIGDPKQSIYRFRGADIHAYLKAKQAAEPADPLTVNRRSTQPLVDAVNHLFSRVENPFGHPGIPYIRVQATPENQPRHDGAPLHLRVLTKRQSPPKWRQETISNDAGEKACITALVHEISTLLNDRAEVHPGDIAVLVDNHRQAGAVYHALQQHGIACVRRGKETVFETPEARDLFQLLQAIEEPHRSAVVRGALATPFFQGLDDALAANTDDASVTLEPHLTHVRQLRDDWYENGFLRMFHRFIRQSNVLAEWAGTVNGERAITNLLHLGEVLGQTAIRNHLGPSLLLRWFSNQMQSRMDANDTDENLMRLESDEQRVKIATLHAAKGLEYDHVWIPFGWKLPRPWADFPPQGVTFHDPVDNVRKLDLGSPKPGRDEHFAAAMKEESDEQMRLLYVGITRACHECTLYWVPGNQVHRTALSALLLPPNIDGKAPDDVVRDHLLAAIGGAVGKIDVRPFPPLDVLPPDAPCALDRIPDLDHRPRTRRPGPVRRILSFSAIKSARATDYDSPDHADAAPGPLLTELDLPEPGADDAHADILAFTRGTRTGNLLHEVFEYIDFTLPPDATETQNIIRTALTRHRFDPSHQYLLTDWVGNVLATELPAATTPFCLADIPTEERLNEMEFYFQLDLRQADALARLFDGRLPDDLRLYGTMKGYIDLIVHHNDRFHVMDYKSNGLGPRLADYHPAAIDETMKHHLYDLQYHLYLVALHRYLRARLPDYTYDTHIGETFYLFLRAMPHAGVFTHRPEATFIEELSAILSSSKK